LKPSQYESSWIYGNWIELEGMLFDVGLLLDAKITNEKAKEGGQKSRVKEGE